MPHDTPEERAKALLQMHGGACSVPAVSELQRAFFIMSLAGEVTIEESSTPGFVNVYAKPQPPPHSNGENGEGPEYHI